MLLHSVRSIPRHDPLPEGVLQRAVDMKLAKEMWRVVIDVETDQQAWTELVSTFNATIEQLTQALGSGWKLQLIRLQQRVQNLAHRHAMHASRTGTRARRGLIDGVGQLGHYLFGLATETEI